MRLYSTFDSKEWLEAYQKVFHTEYKDYNDIVKRGWLDFHEIGIFFEGIGILLQRKLLDISLVDDLLGNSVQSIVVSDIGTFSSLFQIRARI